MICFIAIFVFGILGIFSAKYRSYAKEAFSCTFRKMTLRKCDTAFDDRMKGKIAGKLMKRSPKAARFVYRRFEIISWIFTIILIVSLIFTVITAYNLIVYGTCDPQNPGQCIFNPNNPDQCTAQACGSGCDADCTSTCST